MRLVITVDGMQAAKLAKYGIIPRYKLEQWRREFANSFDISSDGVRIKILEPMEGLKAWHPIA